MSKLREDRNKCWEARDAYYACLDASDPPIVVPPREGEKHPKQCLKERAAFSKNCARSWIDYFNQRRVLAFQQKEILAVAQKQHEEAGKTTRT